MTVSSRVINEAQALVESESISRLKGNWHLYPTGEYLVALRGSRRPGEPFTIKEARCSCPAGRHRHSCKHVLAALILAVQEGHAVDLPNTTP